MISDDKRSKGKHLGKVLIPQNRKKVHKLLLLRQFPGCDILFSQIRDFSEGEC